MRTKGKLIFREENGKERIVGYTGSKEFIEEVLTIVDLHSRKNADYSKDDDPYSNFFVVEEVGVPAYIGVFVRMSDKWERLKNLLAKGEENRAVKEEGLIDTARDLAVYSLIFVTLLKKRNVTNDILERMAEEFGMDWIDDYMTG